MWKRRRIDEMGEWKRDKGKTQVSKQQQQQRGYISPFEVKTTTIRSKEGR
jgi:hypothetical protein